MIPGQDFQVNSNDSPRNYNFIFLDKKHRSEVVTVARQRARMAQKMMKETYPVVTLNHNSAVLTVTIRYKALSAHYESLLTGSLATELEKVQRKMRNK